MKTNQKGNVLVLAVLIIAAILAGGYSACGLYTPRNSQTPIVQNPTPSNPTPNNPQPNNPVTPAPIPAPTPTPVQPAGFKQYAPAKDTSDTVNAANQFAFELYNQYKNTTDNVFFSPYSISSALEMTYEGARGQTAREMQSVFHFSADQDIRIPSFAKLYSQINAKNDAYQLSTANALWAQKDYPFDPNYVKTIATYYGGNASNLDFKNDAENSRQTINSWVSSKTNSKIPELLAKGILNGATRLVLTNAIYFKSKWESVFKKNATQPQDFTTAAKNKIKAPTMYQEAHFNYGETSDYQAIELPYENNDLSMVIILPRAGNTGAVEGNLGADSFGGLKKSLKSELVDVYLPKFKFDTAYSMSKTLVTMGMPTAFDSDNADFAGMYDKVKANNDNLYISDVIHKAYVDLNEDGTEAAAATAVVMITAAIAHGPARPEPKVFRADHPFIFAIVHNATGSILFLGKVNDPTK